MKKKIIIISIVVAVVLLLSSIAVWAFDLPIGEMMGRIYANKNQSQYNEVVAKVYDDDVKMYRIKASKPLYPELSESEILDVYIDSLLIMRDAEAKGFTVSDEELQGFIKEQKEGITHLDKNDNVYILFQDTLEGLQVTFDEYWELDDVVHDYKKFFMNAKVLDQLFNEKGCDSFEEKQVAKTEYLNELREKAKGKITIYSEKLDGGQN